MAVRIEELMRGSIIEYQEDRPLATRKGKWFKDIVWGFSTDDNYRDVVEIGINGVEGFIDLVSINGIELTEDILLDYGFIQIQNSSDSISFFRDDFGYVKLSTYGIQHVYMLGKSIKFLHNFQRVFYDYMGKTLKPKVTDAPKEVHRLQFELKKPLTNDEMLKGIEDIKKIEITSKEIPKLILKFP